jgi:hypothetical protein
MPRPSQPFQVCIIDWSSELIALQPEGELWDFSTWIIFPIMLGLGTIADNKFGKNKHLEKYIDRDYFPSAT